MRRVLPEQWLISVACGPLAVVVAGVALAWSPWVGALALVGPALLLALASVGVNVLASYLLGILAGASALVFGGLHPQKADGALLVAPIAVCLGVTLLSQLVLGDRLRHWSAAMGGSVFCAGVALVLAMLDGDALRTAPDGGPEILATVPRCTEHCRPYQMPGGHKGCSQLIENEHLMAVRECGESSSFLRVWTGDVETSVLLARGEQAVVWREPSGNVVVEQGGLPLRAVSAHGAVQLSASFTALAPKLPAYALQMAGASLLFVGIALSLVLRSLRMERSLSGGVVGHVEAGRFFPRDGHLTPMSLTHAHGNGPALLFGNLRTASYRDGGGVTVRVVSGTLRELSLGHHRRRFRACALALSALLFAWVGVAADLARLQ
jgi:hypothetical protein